MGEERAKGDTRRYRGVGGIAEAGGIIPWLIIKIVQGTTKRLKKNSGKERGESNENNA